jgi:uncharacterized membrane protein YGL010W
MRTADQWFNVYTATHEHPVNKLIHRFCAPLAAISIIGLLWSLPSPEAFTRISPALNWGSAFVMAAIVYYFIISITLGFGMILVMLGLMAGIHWLGHQWPPLWASSLGLLLSCLLAMLAGHALEGQKVRLLYDLQLVMLAPIFLLAVVYRRLGISY